MKYLLVANFASVLFFGIVLSLSFAGIDFKKNRKQHILIFLGFGIIQLFSYLALGDQYVYELYPLLTHLPLFLLLKYYYKKNIYIAGISILSAYLFCTPRKWVGTFIASFFGYDMKISFIVQILITIPLLIAIIKYFCPYVVLLKYEGTRILTLFIAVPLIYYLIEFILTVYTNLLYQNSPAIVEFMDSSVVVIYFIYSIVFLKTLYKKKEIEVEQEVFKILANQSRFEIEALRKSQKQAAIYRHDLRHHLSFLNSCIVNSKPEEALAYISETCDEIDSSMTIQYSENESVNLILSAYATRAAEKKIPLEITVTTNEFGKFSTSDLCSLLSNALENAIHATEKITDHNQCFIKLHLYSKSKKLCIDIRNSYQMEPVFAQDFPVSLEQHHGFGTKSMAHIVDKHGGVYQFSASNGIFIFQATA
ncbi:MAG TPA: GHKL domain-containing protein [Lachnospiraceae bacterium]|nr:GHKL domain-containing protein [Lachnospiraceae bacterium]